MPQALTLSCHQTEGHSYLRRPCSIRQTYLMKCPLLLKLCSMWNDDHVAKQLTKAAWSRNSAILQAPASTSPLSNRHELEGRAEGSEGKLRLRQRMPVFFGQRTSPNPAPLEKERSERDDQQGPFCPWTRSAPEQPMLLVPAVAHPCSRFSLDEILSSTASPSKTLGVQHLVSSE